MKAPFFKVVVKKGDIARDNS